MSVNRGKAGGPLVSVPTAPAPIAGVHPGGAESPWLVPAQVAARRYSHAAAVLDGAALGLPLGFNPAPTTPATMTCRVYLYVAIAAVANVLFGYETSVISGAKTDFAMEYPLNAVETGVLVAANPAGATLGAAIAGLLQDAFGRRITLIGACVWYVGAVLISMLSHGFPQLAAGRLATGFVIGLLSSTAPLYISELSPSHARGFLLTVNQVCICTGILLGFVSNLCISPAWRWELFAGIPLAALLLGLFVVVTPFSPRWLVSKGRVEEARSVLLALRGDESTAEAELAGIEASIEHSRQ